MSREGMGNFSQLQHLVCLFWACCHINSQIFLSFSCVAQLQLSYSSDPDDQQRAAIDMAHLVEGASVFPAVSFGPISHALCKLVPSTNRTVASYSARAMKLLLLDDALRPQVRERQS